VKGGEHLHGVVERVELGLDARRGRVRETANLRCGKNGDAFTELFRSAARLLCEKSALPGKPIAMQAVRLSEQTDHCARTMRTATIANERCSSRVG
jgi:hypothetical protein